MVVIKPNNMTYHYQPPKQKQKHDLSTFGYGLGMGSGWVNISPLPVPYPYYEFGENANSYPNPVKAGKTSQIGVGLGGTHEHRFCCHAYREVHKERRSIKLFVGAQGTRGFT
jgi:hypothetical protein